MNGRVAVVTGASRGAGRGIAAALAAKGWRVYATGRTITEAPPGGVAVRVDHADDDAVAALFERVRRMSGRLDLLVNNAAAISDELVSPKPFWEKPLALADVLDVGLRSSYVASWHAAPLLVARRARSDRLHLLAGIGVLHARPGVRGAESGDRQDGRRHGGGLPGHRRRDGVDLDGHPADREAARSFRGAPRRALAKTAEHAETPNSPDI